MACHDVTWHDIHLDQQAEAELPVKAPGKAALPSQAKPALPAKMWCWDQEAYVEVRAKPIEDIHGFGRLIHISLPSGRLNIWKHILPYGRSACEPFAVYMQICTCMSTGCTVL